MKSQIPSNDSKVYPILVCICEMAVKFSFLKPLRRIFGRYFGNELLIIVSVLTGIIFIIISPWASYLGAFLYHDNIYLSNIYDGNLPYRNPST